MAYTIQDATQAGNSIGNIFKFFGKREGIRQQREQLINLDNAINSGMQLGQAVEQVRNAPTTYDKGPMGILQGIGNVFKPQNFGPDILDELLANDIEKRRDYELRTQYGVGGRMLGNTGLKMSDAFKYKDDYRKLLNIAANTIDPEIKETVNRELANHPWVQMQDLFYQQLNNTVSPAPVSGIVEDVDPIAQAAGDYMQQSQLPQLDPQGVKEARMNRMQQTPEYRKPVASSKQQSTGNNYGFSADYVMPDKKQAQTTGQQVSSTPTRKSRQAQYQAAHDKYAEQLLKLGDVDRLSQHLNIEIDPEDKKILKHLASIGDEQRLQQALAMLRDKHGPAK